MKSKTKEELPVPQCELCKYYEFCIKENVDKKSLFCLWNFYADGVVANYYENHLDEYAMLEDELIYKVCEELECSKQKKN